MVKCGRNGTSPIPSCRSEKNKNLLMMRCLVESIQCCYYGFKFININAMLSAKSAYMYINSVLAMKTTEILNKSYNNTVFTNSRFVYFLNSFLIKLYACPLRRYI